MLSDLFFEEIRSMAILLVRHGETAMNATRTIQWPDTPLSDRGQEQARRVGERFSTAPIAQILVSDYERASATAEAIRKSTDAPLEVWEGLRERHLGDLRGKAYEELDVDPFAEDYHPPNGESWPQFHARVAKAWGDVLVRAASLDGDLVVVSHGLVIRSVCEEIVGYPPDADPLVTVFLNTCVTVFDGPPWHIPLLACAAHLDDTLAVQGGAA
ncbi:MAG: histidine phosphatase family protein [Chromatiales bacterium]|jgi:2,3-bisphosphoglycerate-dependent phosphoglycerate mutase|nr:histidine phosphatase family protein [Chromatiales bacterium]